MLEKYNHKNHSFLHSLERHADIHRLSFFCVLSSLFALLLAFGSVRGATSSNFTMSILPQPLAVNIVDQDYNPIEEPQVDFTELPYVQECREITTQLATDEQQIYIRNLDAADGGWTVTISADNPASLWSSGDYKFDFNDTTDNGCTDGIDDDIFAWSMQIYSNSGVLSPWLCPSCSIDFVDFITSWIFDEENWINTVTIAHATTNSDNRWDWRLSNIFVRQTVPASQPAVGEYEIPLLLSITAN